MKRREVGGLVSAGPKHASTATPIRGAQSQRGSGRDEIGQGYRKSWDWIPIRKKEFSRKACREKKG